MVYLCFIVHLWSNKKHFAPLMKDILLSQVKLNGFNMIGHS